MQECDFKAFKESFLVRTQRNVSFYTQDVCSTVSTKKFSIWFFTMVTSWIAFDITHEQILIGITSNMPQCFKSQHVQANSVPRRRHIYMRFSTYVSNVFTSWHIIMAYFTVKKNYFIGPNLFYNTHEIAPYCDEVLAKEINKTPV